jgi:hypothetical protein
MIGADTNNVEIFPQPGRLCFIDNPGQELTFSARFSGMSFPEAAGKAAMEGDVLQEGLQ